MSGLGSRVRVDGGSGRGLECARARRVSGLSLSSLDDAGLGEAAIGFFFFGLGASDWSDPEEFA